MWWQAASGAPSVAVAENENVIFNSLLGWSGRIKEPLRKSTSY
jgi:hypothetical protein